MADDTRKETSLAGESDALKGDIAKILDGVKIPETEGEKLSRAINDPMGKTGNISEDVGLLKTTKPPVPSPSTATPSVESVGQGNPMQHVPPASAEPLISLRDSLQKPNEPVPSSVIPPIVKGDIAQIVESTKLPESRGLRMSGDTPVTTVMPQEPPAGIDLAEARATQESALTPNPAPKAGAAKDASAITPMRTLKGDMNVIVETSKMSIVHAAALEEEKKSKVAKNTSVIEVRRARERMRHILTMLFAIIVLFGIGGAALFGVYTITRLQQGVLPQGPSASILFAEHTVSLSIDNQTPDQIKQIIAQARSTTGTIGSITRIVPMITVTNPDGTPGKRPAKLKEFLKALGTRAPDDLLRALSESFFFGIHSVDKNAPIMVVPVVSYSRAFAGMLSWEPTMNADLVPAFTAVSAMTRDENGLPVPRAFQDAVMNNYDIRKLTDDAGNIVLYYSFPSTQLLVIAESPYSFVEILSRLRAGRHL